MTDGQFLLLIFALLYLYECLRWVPGRAIVWKLFGRATEPGAWSRIAPLELFRTRWGLRPAPATATSRGSPGDGSLACGAPCPRLVSLG